MTDTTSIKEPNILILSQVSKERYRRRLLVVSRVLALCLILAIVYFGYTQYKYGALIERSPCYACGYYEGKRCEYAYVTSWQKIDKEEFLISLGKYNENHSGYSQWLGGSPANLNVSGINFSLISNGNNK